ncbi:TPA: hypothetical protein U5E24_004157 [Yersinia enterocolitica]|nr:hypothetical protein [Yersinia enterocolitica]HEN3633515.1 hypothetical protein [Yersinia enterocolitica]HEN3660278.1 hypothetical protein [Yersinia enterocolitica]HEN3664383.1 hypothetical protein [Yersinia enterocolitica]
MANSAVGATVVIAYAGKPYQAIVQNDGSWHLDILAGVLTGIADGIHFTGAWIVKDIQVSTVGGVLQPSGKLMEIVPIEEQLLIETRINPRDIGLSDKTAE